ncbi:MAG: hypothetical protein IMY71_06970 [Bacteroidetes bacterium]|nr:hypothetical protein [Bacteroidota bacterium]
MITTGQLLLFFLLAFHPVHVSVTSMEYNKGENIFLVSFKVFTDDFETIVERKYGVDLNLGKEDELKNADEYFNRYFRESFNFMVNGEELKEPVFLEKKINDIAVWLYYRYPISGNVEEVEIKNIIMLDMFRDQSNLLIFKYNNFEKGFIFDREKVKIQFQPGKNS